MPKFSIHVSPSALEDLQNITTYYDQQDAHQVGENTIRNLIKSVEDLTTHPEMGRIVPEFNTPMLRELIKPPFRVVYKLDRNKNISIIRIWRNERVLELP